MDLISIREDFPILTQTINNKPLVYFDNGATTQKPQVVINTLKDYYEQYNSNVHRGVHTLSQKATDAEEAARHTIAKFIGAKSDQEIIFTKGTTDSLNLIAHSLGMHVLNHGDEIILPEMEHHSNIVPWQLIAAQKGAKIKTWGITAEGTLDIESFKALITDKTKILSITWVSNALGVINPIKEIIEIAKKHNIKVVVDAAQSIQHLPINVSELGADFVVFSGHKIYGPTGIGVLWGNKDALDTLPPYQGGGSMIKEVFMDHSTYQESPFRFEAGTPHIAGIIGLGAAIQYLQDIGIDKIKTHESELVSYAESELEKIDGIEIYAPKAPKSGAISFNFKGIHPFDVGELLNMQGVAVRTGHHCCQPLMRHFQIPGTIRASFALYNTKDEIDMLIKALSTALKMLR